MPRTPLWLATAALLHAAVVAGLLLLPAPRRAGVSLPTEASAEVTITVDETDAPRPSPVGARATPDEAAPERHDQAAREPLAARSATPGVASAAPAGASSTEAMIVAPGAPGEAAAPGASGTGGVVPVPLSASQLGLGGAGTNPFLPRSAASAETGPPPRPAAEEGLRAALRESDRVRGFGPEGPVMRALSEATSMSIAPFRGRAVFDVHAGSDGEVSRIDLVDANGDSAWHDARRIAVQELRGKKLKIPSGATAMIMRIEVVSEWKMPDGASAAGSFGGRRDGNGTPELTIPDPANIGAKPRRVVRARSVSTQVL